MAYTRGEVQIATAGCPESDDLGYCPHSPEHRRPWDAKLGEAFLPHSCDEWVIGGPEQVRALIEDLRAALAEMEREIP